SCCRPALTTRIIPRCPSSASEPDAAMLSQTLFAEWLRRYEAAWETRDPASAMAIFTADATYRETPFEAPMAGRAAIGDYWRAQVEACQDNVDFSFAVLEIDGDIGFARWRSRFDWRPTGRRLELEGIFRCRFRLGGPEDGLCCLLEEWWHQREIGAAAAK